MMKPLVSGADAMNEQMKRSKTILLANADEQLDGMVVSVLEAKHYAVTKVDSGKAAMHELENGQFDLCIIGDELTDIDGIGLIVKLRQEGFATNAVFVSNAWRDAGLYSQLTKDFGVSLVVHRPLHSTLFASLIDNQFGTHEVSAALVSPTEMAGVQALRQKLSKVLPDRLDSITDVVERAKSHPEDVALLDEARRLAHNLKGTSRSCAFERVGEVSERLESTLVKIQQSNLANYEDVWHEVDMIVNQMKTAVNADLTESKLDKRSSEEEQEELDDPAGVRVMFVSTEAAPPASRSSKGLPFSVIPVSDSKQAVAKAGQMLLDAVVIDTDSGDAYLELAYELRELPGYENLPVAFLSPTSHKNNLSDSTHAGVSLHLDKPVRSEALSDAVQYLIGIGQGGRPRILVIDDDEDFAGLIGTTLGREGMIVQTVHEPSSVLSVMDEYKPDLVLLDVNMPFISGFEVCRMLRANQRWQDVPILFLTAQIGLDARLSAFESGGDDYLPKPVSTVELLTRVKTRLERARMIRERSDRDQLSGLLVRRAFIERAKSLIDEGTARKQSFSLALLDVDHFKKVNDTYGHLAGDRVLAYLGQLLRRRFRVEDLRGRWGGEEFILAFNRASTETIKGSIERVLRELRAYVFEGDYGEWFRVTFSCGLCSFPDDGQALDELVKVADLRLYAAKERGRNQIVDS